MRAGEESGEVEENGVGKLFDAAFVLPSSRKISHRPFCGANKQFPGSSNDPLSPRQEQRIRPRAQEISIKARKSGGKVISEGREKRSGQRDSNRSVEVD